MAVQSHVVQMHAMVAVVVVVSGRMVMRDPVHQPRLVVERWGLVVHHVDLLGPFERVRPRLQLPMGPRLVQVHPLAVVVGFAEY